MKVTDAGRFDALVDAVGLDLLRFFQRRVGDDAADLVAETLVVVWSRIGRLPRPAEEARMWVFGIAHNVLIKARRGHVRRSRLADRLRGLAPSGGVEVTDAAVLDVRAAIAALGEVDADLIRLIHWDGFGVAEAGQVIGLKPSTARTRYARAKVALRELLSDEDEEEDSRLAPRKALS